MTALVLLLVAVLVWAISAQSHVVAGSAALALIALVLRGVRREAVRTHSTPRR